ncbi:unnamed protein product [Blepharisma stoltei]|uniref:RING-type domain-containing protein n=1 Tax=Blepharisma stoltei TaxID=1481888 RepID=A0AAU9JWX8_9CILI|nr:unnamed protein product [Blepharisma stoltei]
MEAKRQEMKLALIGMGFEESKVDNVLMLTDDFEDAVTYLTEGINANQIALSIKNNIISQLKEMGFSSDIANMAAERYKIIREAAEFATNASMWDLQGDRPQYNLRPIIPPPLPAPLPNTKQRIVDQLREFGFDNAKAQEISNKFNNYEEAIEYATSTIHLNQAPQPPQIEPEPNPQEYEDPENELDIRDISINLYRSGIPAEEAFARILQWLGNEYVEDHQIVEVPHPFPSRTIARRDFYGQNPQAQSIYISPESINIEGRKIRGTSREEIIDILGELYPPKGASEEAKSKISEILYRNSMSQKECVICQEDFKHNDRLFQLPCSHIYHKKCITKWLAMSEACPVDNLKIE